jgi:Glycosyltransferase family 28 N-terminal domain
MTLGTRGDVQPFVALARALDAAGHEAVVCGPHRFEDFVVGHGIRFAGVDDGPMRQLDSPAEAGNVIQGGFGRGCVRCGRCLGCSTRSWPIAGGSPRRVRCRRAGNRPQRTDPRWTAFGGGAGRAGGLGVADPDVCPDRSFPVGRAGAADVVAGAAEPCQLWRHEDAGGDVRPGDRSVAQRHSPAEASPGPS